MTTLSIDIETYSSNDLLTGGVYKYVEAEDFTILLIAYAYDGGEVHVCDTTCDELPKKVLTDLFDPNVKKTAWNAQFERVCIAKAFGFDRTRYIPQWECTMVRAAMLGMPFGLDACAKALRLETQKDAAGKALIKYFSVPCKPTKVNGGRTRNLPEHAPEKWQAFIDYCAQDVRTELAIAERISFFTMPGKERELWILDQAINDRGVRIDPILVANAIQVDEHTQDLLSRQSEKITGLSNPNSPVQLKGWLSDRMGSDITGLTKQDVSELLEVSTDKAVTQVLENRQQLAKTSVKKYISIQECMCADQRVRGLLQFYGANRTGRWAGRLIQVQNLPRNYMPDLDLARGVLLTGDAELMGMLYTSVPDTLSQLIRTAFVPKKGCRFIVSDFSAIEARVIAWLAGEQWVLDVFKSHGRIYEATAARMFRVPIESIDKGSDLRQKGKVATLALGYQGGAGALIAMGALEMGISEDDLRDIADLWRKSNPAIVRLWYDVENAAIEAVKGQPNILNNLRFTYLKGTLCITLPSGRSLFYPGVRLSTNRFGKQALEYLGANQTTKQWGYTDTYGGKLVENITQAVARDCLAEAMLSLDAAGYKIVMSIHDEVVLEVPTGFGSVADVNGIMSQGATWIKGLPLHAEGYECEYYKKD